MRQYNEFYFTRSMCECECILVCIIGNITYNPELNINQSSFSSSILKQCILDDIQISKIDLRRANNNAVT